MKIEKHIIPHFGDKMCSEITSKSAYEFMQKKLDSGLSPCYVADIMVLLKTVFKYARREYSIMKDTRCQMQLLSASSELRCCAVFEEGTSSVFKRSHADFDENKVQTRSNNTQ